MKNFQTTPAAQPLSWKERVNALGNLLGLRTIPTGVKLYTCPTGDNPCTGTTAVTTAGGNINLGAVSFSKSGLGAVNKPGTLLSNWANNSSTTPLYAASPACGDGNGTNPQVLPTPQPSETKIAHAEDSDAQLVANSATTPVPRFVKKLILAAAAVVTQFTIATKEGVNGTPSGDLTLELLLPKIPLSSPSFLRVQILGRLRILPEGDLGILSMNSR